jgi:hypothetical protein
MVARLTAILALSFGFLSLALAQNVQSGAKSTGSAKESETGPSGQTEPESAAPRSDPRLPPISHRSPPLQKREWSLAAPKLLHQRTRPKVVRRSNSADGESRSSPC